MAPLQKTKKQCAGTVFLNVFCPTSTDWCAVQQRRIRLERELLFPILI